MMDKLYTVFGYIGIGVALGVLVYLIVTGNLIGYLL